MIKSSRSLYNYFMNVPSACLVASCEAGKITNELVSGLEVEFPPQNLKVVRPESWRNSPIFIDKIVLCVLWQKYDSDSWHICCYIDW